MVDVCNGCNVVQSNLYGKEDPNGRKDFDVPIVMMTLYLDTKEGVVAIR